LNKKHYGKKQQPRKKNTRKKEIIALKKLEEGSLNTKGLMRGL
jgi:hypothetical protein